MSSTPSHHLPAGVPGPQLLLHPVLQLPSQHPAHGEGGSRGIPLQSPSSRSQLHLLHAGRGEMFPMPGTMPTPPKVPPQSATRGTTGPHQGEGCQHHWQPWHPSPSIQPPGKFRGPCTAATSGVPKQGDADRGWQGEHTSPHHHCHPFLTPHHSEHPRMTPPQATLRLTGCWSHMGDDLPLRGKQSRRPRHNSDPPIWRKPTFHHPRRGLTLMSLPLPPEAVSETHPQKK